MNQKHSIFWITAAAGAFVLASATAAGQPKGSADSHFVMEAAEGGIAEVEMGKLATEKASSPDVKNFGQRMVDDHSKANDDLKRVMSQKGVTLPAGPSAKHKAKMDKMSKLSGAAFDKAYMDDMLADHIEDVAAFQKEATSGKDPDAQAFAARTLPTLQEHLKMAQDIHAKLSGKATGGQ
jgi:putative membrane protein